MEVAMRQFFANKRKKRIPDEKPLTLNDRRIY
jgi:hypothetical protein